jgi:Ca2+-binding RTX toxin-like protein
MGALGVRWLVVVLFAIVPASASAAPTTDLTSGTLTVVGDGTGETFTISTNGSEVRVAGPSGMPDPDGGGTNCTAAASQVSCLAAVATTVIVDGAGGADTITDQRAGTISATDSLRGGPGNDTLVYAPAAAGPTLVVDLQGGPDDDDITLGADNATALGAGGNDTLRAGSAAFDSASSGGPGNDVFVGGAGAADSFVAEDGADTYGGGSSGTPGEEPTDTIDYSARTDRIVVTLDGAAGDGSAGENDNVFADIENVATGAGNDEITGSDAANNLNGGDGDDVLSGLGGDDALAGGLGSDVLRGGDGSDGLSDGDFTPGVSDTPLPAAGNDRLDGGAGADSLQSDRGADDITGGAGTDLAVFQRPITQPSSTMTPVQYLGFEISLDDAANDGGRGENEGDNVHSDIEELVTSAGPDSITGTSNSDSIATGGGNDTVNPGAGADLVQAGPGDDVVSAVDGATDRVECDEGNDTATLDLAGAQPERADVAIDCESVSGTPFPAVVLASTVPPAADVAAPVLTLVLKRMRAKAFLRRGVVPVRATCSEACSLAGALFSDRAKIARVGELSVGAGRLKSGTGTRVLRVRVAKPYLKAFRKKLRGKARRRKGVTLVLAVTARDAAGNAKTVRRKLVVRG